MAQEKQIGGRRVFLYGEPGAGVILVQPVDENEWELLDTETAMIREGMESCEFCLAAFLIKDWNRELSPWVAPPVFGKEGFGDGAEETLSFITEGLLPGLLGREKEEITRDQLELSGKRIVLGGYSLAGLFALWAAHRTDLFKGIAAVSPSVWFPGWDRYSAEHEILAEGVYLSLGDKEEKTKNAVMAKVGDAIRQQYEELLSGAVCKKCVLEWNQGNHFTDPERRTAKGFVWTMKNAVDIS